MSLISAVLGFFLRKGVLLALTILVLFLGYLLLQVAVPALREAAADRERLEQVQRDEAVAEADLEELESQAEDDRSKTIGLEFDMVDEQLLSLGADAADKLEEQEDACGRLQKVFDFAIPGPGCADAQRGLEAAQDALAAAKERQAILNDPDLSTAEKVDELGLGVDEQLASQIETTESELTRVRTEEGDLRAAQNTAAGFVVDQWSKSWRWLALLAVVVLLTPVLARVSAYFVLMPWVSRVHRPLHLAAGSEHGPSKLHTSNAERTLTVRLEHEQVLSARSEHVRPVRGRVRSRLLYDWSAPFVSFAAGLYGLSRVIGDHEGTVATLAPPDDPDSYLMRIDFDDHPGLVMRPSHVVGVIGAPQLQTRWRWGIQALATWQVRYIMFTGTGSLIVQGTGDVIAQGPEGGSMRMDQHLVMGFDSRLRRGIERNEAFWPYLQGRTPLVVDEFTGVDRFFWQKSNTQGPTNPVVRVFNSVFSALGKLLGF